MWGAAVPGKVVIMTQHDEQVATTVPAHERRPVRQLLAASVGDIEDKRPSSVGRPMGS